MTARALARHYAQALFEVAQRNGRTEAIRRDLVEFAALVSSRAELTRAFRSAASRPAQRAGLVQALIDASTGLSAEVARLLLLLADRDRLMLLDDIAASFVERVMSADLVVRADVTTAVALDGAAKTGLVNTLSSAVGRQVAVAERVDDAIIGGLVASVGSVVFDGSVSRQVERLREKLLAQV